MRILVVCLGNICRSPMAEAVFKRLAKEQGLPWTVRSAGTNRYHKGEHADPRTIAACERGGLDIRDHIARRLTPEDFDHSDVVLSMAEDVLEEMQPFIRSPKDASKVVNFLDVIQGGDTPDPWYGGDAGFDQCLKLVERACLAWTQKGFPRCP
jgi:protein-tyrosine phosphatase